VAEDSADRLAEARVEVVGIETRRAKLHLAAAVLVAVVLPGGSLLAGGGVFAWTMFSKSETYRITIEGIGLEGEKRAFDPRSLAPYVHVSIGHFLPAKDRLRHDPVGLTFRTGLQHIADLACRLSSLHSVEVTLEERQDLDAAPRMTVARARCR
jgi:hypothetical protein